MKSKVKSKGRARGPSNVGASGTNQLDGEENVTDIGMCDDAFPASEKDQIRCPKICPLMRFDSKLLCHWKCITEERCNEYPGVIDRETGYCRVCAVAGCKRCMEEEQTCVECQDGFVLRDGACATKRFLMWYIVLGTLGFLVFLALVYFIYLAWRPVVSEQALEWGLEARSRMKARQDHGDLSLYPLNMSLADEVTSAGGIGALLHFSWQRMTLWWSISVTVAFAAVTAHHGRLNFLDVAELAPMHDEAQGVCSEILDRISSGQFEALRINILWLTGIVYAGTSVGAIVWSWWQQQKFQSWKDDTTDMQDFALLCRGFPAELEKWSQDDSIPDRDKTLEAEYREFFQSTWGDGVAAVSIVWNTTDKQEQTLFLLHNIVLDKEKDFRDGLKNASHPDPHKLSEKFISFCDTPRTHSRESAESQYRRSSGCLCAPLLAAIDGLWWGELPAFMERLKGQSPNTDATQAAALNLIHSLPTTGFCFVMFRTPGDKARSLSTPLPRFRGEHEILVDDAEGVAESVLWDNFSTTDEERFRLVMMGVGQILLLIVVWTLCFWGPYTYYILTWAQVAGASQGNALVATSVGFLITLGNQIVYAVCGMISIHAKFTNRKDQDTYYTGLYTFAVFVNTILDMWLVTVMAKGWQRDASLDMEALVRNPSMQHALFTQLVLYLWPMTLLGPFVLEPVVLNVIPYFLGKWLVRSRHGCTKQEAETCMEPPPFDLNRYGDVLINVMMVCLFFFLTAVTIWWIFLMLSISLLFIYGWDCYRFKRATMRTHFESDEVDVLAQYVMIIPCAILAGSFVFKLEGGQAMVNSWDRDSFLEENPELWKRVCLAIGAHVMLHALILALLVPRYVRKDDTAEQEMADERYEDCAQEVCCNYLNSNPVHCLRSFFIYENRPSHIFYQPGREYLHKKNDRPEDKDALIIYEAQGFAHESGFWDDLKMSARESYLSARESVTNLYRRDSEQEFGTASWSSGQGRTPRGGLSTGRGSTVFQTPRS